MKPTYLNNGGCLLIPSLKKVDHLLGWTRRYPLPIIPLPIRAWNMECRPNIDQLALGNLIPDKELPKALSRVTNCLVSYLIRDFSLDTDDQQQDLNTVKKCCDENTHDSKALSKDWVIRSHSPQFLSWDEITMHCNAEKPRFL